MNLDKLFTWIVGVVIAFAMTGNLDTLQRWILRAQAKVIYESRTSTWGSPRFFSNNQIRQHFETDKVKDFKGCKKISIGILNNFVNNINMNDAAKFINILSKIKRELGKENTKLTQALFDKYKGTSDEIFLKEDLKNAGLDVSAIAARKKGSTKIVSRKSFLKKSKR